jgi:hypothetical protein
MLLALPMPGRFPGQNRELMFIGVPVERRCATDAICLHDPDFKRTPK